MLFKMSLRRVLVDHKSSFLRDLMILTIDDFMKEGYMSQEDYERIQCTSLSSSSYDDYESRVVENFYEWLLDLPESDLRKFVDFLKEWYTWLYKLFHLRDLTPIGGLPFLLIEHVPRRKLVTQLERDLLSNMYNIIVLNGMIGSGKTTLAADVLHKKSVLENFSDGVFWLDAGKDRNNLIQHLQALLNEKLINREPNLNSDWEIARTQLKSRVPSGALLVLDSVSFNGNASNVIEALNIGCKMLIITSDITIIPNEYKTHVIKVDAAFTHDEARELIANKLQISVSSLPKKAHELYKVTKGYPLILSYIIDKLEEDSEIAMKDDGHWDYYMKPLLELKKLSFSKIAPNLGHNFPESIWNKIGYSINKLPTDEKDKFYDLCVFVEDANISPETLVVLWSCCKSKVLELMTVLMKKNLVVRRYNKKLGDYVYGVHSIFVLYLNRLIERGESTSRTVQDLHLKLVSKYREFYRSDFSKIPVNDAYMYNYLGHHLMRAGQYSELPILYSDLKFLEARLRIVGPGNLLAELKMYRTESENNKLIWPELLDDLEQLIMYYGQQLYMNKDLTIVQLAFVNSNSHQIHRLASRFANFDKCYIQFKLFPRLQNHNVLNCKLPISALCSHPDILDLILIGYENGNLCLWSFPLQKMMCRLELHNSQISKILFDKSGKYVLTCSLDGTAVVLVFDSLFAITSESSSFHRMSPQQCQNDYLHLWCECKSESRILKHGSPLISADFASTVPPDLLVVTCSQSTIKVWEVNFGKRLRCIRSHLTSDNATCCAFSHDNNYVLVGYSKSAEVYSVDNGHIVKSIDFTHPIIDIQLYRDGNFLILTEMSLNLWGVSTDDDPVVGYSLIKGKKYACFSASSNFFCVVPAAPASIEVYSFRDSQKIDIRSNSRYHCLKSVSCVESKTDGGRCCWVVGLYHDWTVRKWQVKPPTSLISNRHCSALLNTFRLRWPVSSPGPVFTSVDTCDARNIHVYTNATWSMLRAHLPVGALDMSADGGMIVAVWPKFSDWYIEAWPIASSMCQSRVLMTAKKIKGEDEAPIVKVFTDIYSPFDKQNDIFQCYTFLVATLSEFKVHRRGQTLEYPVLMPSPYEIFYTDSSFTCVFHNGAIQAWKTNRGSLTYRGQKNFIVAACDFWENLLAVVLSNNKDDTGTGTAQGGQVFIYCCVRRKIISQTVTDSVPSACIFLDVARLVIGFCDDTLSVIDTEKLSLLHSFLTKGRVQLLASAGNTIAAIVDSGDIYVWTSEEVKQKKESQLLGSLNLVQSDVMNWVRVPEKLGLEQPDVVDSGRVPNRLGLGQVGGLDLYRVPRRLNMVDPPATGTGDAWKWGYYPAIAAHACAFVSADIHQMYQPHFAFVDHHGEIFEFTVADLTSSLLLD